MKKKYIFILALVAFLAGNVIAAEKVEDVDFDDKPKHRRMSEDRIAKMLEEIAKSSPEKAEELKKLQKEDPDMFMQQLRDYMRKSRNKRDGDGRQGPPEQGRGMRGPGGPEDGPPRGGHWKQQMEQMEKKKEEYIKWMQENYPDEFTRLEELKNNEDHKLYFKQMMISGRKYGRIFEASKNNPELAEVLKQDLVLKEKRDQLIKDIAASDEGKKAELTKELEGVVGQRFDLILKRKQIAYDKLRERLEKLKEEVKTSQDEVAKWKETKDEKVKDRVDVLIKRSEEFNWEE